FRFGLLWFLLICVNFGCWWGCWAMVFCLVWHFVRGGKFFWWVNILFVVVGIFGGVFCGGIFGQNHSFFC
ncbi:hypothetical protein, partial [Salmonella enterica]|uniref:hypothetical protein n=1 Tax=Salmonella enterica TaxID=28901 RepID=UPI0020C260B7